MIRTIALPLLLCALAAPPAFGFGRHLTPDQVRAAYYIGRDQNHRAAFFAAYTHVPQLPPTGPAVQSIEFRTYRNLTAQDVVGTGDGSAGPGTLNGVIVQLHFDILQFQPSDPVIVEVIAPAGQAYATTFDLASLK